MEIGRGSGRDCWKGMIRTLLAIARRYPYVIIGMISVRCLRSEVIVIGTFRGLIGSLLLFLDDLEDDVIVVVNCGGRIGSLRSEDDVIGNCGGQVGHCFEVGGRCCWNDIHRWKDIGRGFRRSCCLFWKTCS